MTRVSDQKLFISETTENNKHTEYTESKILLSYNKADT